MLTEVQTLALSIDFLAFAILLSTKRGREALESIAWLLGIIVVAILQGLALFSPTILFPTAMNLLIQARTQMTVAQIVQTEIITGIAIIVLSLMMSFVIGDWNPRQTIRRLKSYL